MTTRYVDASQPDDTGDGSIGSPKRTPRAAMLASSTGDKILIKTGYCYDPLDGSFLYITGISNVEVGTYGTASDKPILDALTYQNPGVSGWTYVNSGIWKKTFGAYYIRRLWVGSTSVGNLISQRVLGTAKRRATGTGLTTPTANPATESIITAALNSNNIWFGGGATLSYALYVYTGSATIDPPTYYQGIAFIQSDGPGVGKVGSPDGIHVQNQTGIYVHDLHLRGNGSAAIRLQAQNSDSRDVNDCLFEDCVVTAPYQGAFRSGILGEATPTKRIRGSTVRRIYCDYWASPDEMELNTSYNFLSGIADLFNVYDGSIAITVENCTAINSAHNGIVTGSIAMATTPPQGCRVLNNYVRYDPWHTYARGMSCFDADTVFSGNLIDGQNTRSQFAGSPKVIGNVWINMRSSVRKTGVDQWIACESYVFDTFQSGIGNDRYIKINPVNVLIANNTAYAPPGPAISFNHFNSGLADTSNNYPDGSITIKNNIVYGPRGLFANTYEDSGRVVGQQTFSNNCVYNGESADLKFLWRGTAYPINTAPGSTANIEVHPNLDSSHRPQNALLWRTGATIDGFDFNGKRLYQLPNIGAVDDVTAHPRWLLVGT